MLLSFFKCVNWALMVTVICSACFATASPIQDTRLTLRIRLDVYNYAHVENPTLSMARRELTEIFEAMRVSTQWQDTTGRENRPSDCVYSLKIFILGPSGEAAARNQLALGFSSANRSDDQRGAAYVIYPRIEKFVRTHDNANQRGRRLGQVLAHAIAHEIGHILLSTSTHSQTGIMRASWQDDEYKLMVAGQLGFTAMQTEVMRSKLAKSQERGFCVNRTDTPDLAAFMMCPAESREAGSWQVYVEPFSGTPADGSGKIQVSSNGGDFPAWP